MLQSSRLVRAGLTALAALLLCIGLLTNTGQVHAAANGTLTVNNTWTSSWGNQNQVISSFNRGNQIQYNVSVSNSSGSNMNIRLNFDARGVNGVQIEDFSSAILSTPSGNFVWYVQTTVPQNAGIGNYTLRADVWDVDNNSNAGNSSGQFSVNNGGHRQCTTPYAYSGVDHGASFVFLNDCAIQNIADADNKLGVITGLFAKIVPAPVTAFETAAEVGILVLQQDSEHCNNQGALIEQIGGALPVPVPVC